MKQQVQTPITTFEEHASSLNEACKLSAHSISDHFADVGKMIVFGKGGQRELNDNIVNRYGLGAPHSNRATASHNLGTLHIAAIVLQEYTPDERSVFSRRSMNSGEDLGYGA